MSEKDKENKIESNQAYELGFHLVPTLGDDTVGKAFDDVTKLLEKVGGKVVSKSGPALINLEYTMEKVIDSVKSKFNTAYFAWVIFEGGDVQTLKEDLDVDKNVLRYLLVKTEQREGVSVEDVKTMLDPEEEIEDKKEEKTEEAKEVSEEAPAEEETKKESKNESKDSDEKKVDDAIDELVK